MKSELSAQAVGHAKYWMVHGNGPTQIMHRSYEDALAEANRLAAAHPTASFKVLETVSVVKTANPPILTYDFN